MNKFARNLLISVGGIYLMFAVCFCIYQNTREREYKTLLLDTRLQTYNREMAQTLGPAITDSTAFRHYVDTHPMEQCRVTLIAHDGTVIVDSHEPAHLLANHSNRTEVRQALRQGTGYDIKRLSASDHTTYFYSATLLTPHSSLLTPHSSLPLVLRTAVPYSTAITRALRADNTFYLFAATLTALLALVLYYYTRRIGRHVALLRQFAASAEQGKQLDHKAEQQIPDDELGDTAHTIITLFWRLRHAEQEQTRIKHQLTQNAAHELKTPTASIHAYLESILEDPDMPAERRQHFLERCYAQSERMAALLRDMATLTTLGQTTKRPNDQTTQHTTVDLCHIVQTVLDDTALALEERHITPTLQNVAAGFACRTSEAIKHHSEQHQPEDRSSPITPNSSLIKGDPQLLYGLFRNLVDNTIAYATGATQLRITIHHRTDHYAITVADNGAGVPPQHLDKLFERFYRVDKGRSRAAGGTGLGLAIVKNTILAHGGTAPVATPTPGGGLTITFTLPKHNINGK